MASSVVSRVSWNQLGAFDEGIEAAKSEISLGWKSDRQMAAVAGNLRGLLRLSQAIPNVLRALWQSTLELIAARLIEDYEEKAQEIRRSFEKARSILNGLVSLIQSFHNAGGVVQGAEVLGRMIVEVQRLESSIFENWPDFTNQDQGNALAEHERGECLDADEAFARIAGIDKGMWLQRVNERKHRKQS